MQNEIIIFKKNKRIVGAFTTSTLKKRRKRKLLKQFESTPGLFKEKFIITGTRDIIQIIEEHI